MTVDAFADRLARVRHRFVSTLQGKIDDAYAAVPKLSDSAPEAAATVAEGNRCMHGIVGIGPTVGFPATGRAARDVEDVLREPYQNRRGLTDDEILKFKESLHALREAATRELKFVDAGLTSTH
jgi:chemotaxis protein histidine kinase CheA